VSYIVDLDYSSEREGVVLLESLCLVNLTNLSTWERFCFHNSKINFN